MTTSNRSFLHTDQTSPSPNLLPPWLSNSNCPPNARPPSPSVTLSLCPSTDAPSPPIAWLHPERGPDTNIYVVSNFPSHASISAYGDNLIVTEMVACCRELEEGHRAWAAHKKEEAWRLRRVELQLESEKASRKREKMEEIEAKVKALKEEQKVALERIEGEYRDQLAGLRKDAANKEQKMAEQWAAKHTRLSKFIEQFGSCRSRAS